MSVLTRLHAEQGQSIWLDNLSRAMLRDGALAKWIRDGVRGLTSNPTIFAKAIGGSDDYDQRFGELIAAGRSTEEAYWEMVVEDIRGACDEFQPLFEASDRGDGFVSVEVSPALCRDTSGTLAAARDLHRRVGRNNVMIKIPATVEGLDAIRGAIRLGISVNTTLIFGIDRYLAVAEAYIAGLEDRVADGATDLSDVAGVASFFISRVDTEVDRRLGDHPLRGAAALSQGRLAYRSFTETFQGERWAALAERGGRAQRPLWASTGTKDPAYSDVCYVDGLIGPDTVNTVPESTLTAFLDHGTVARTVDSSPSGDDDRWAGLAAAGVDMDEVANQLEEEGLAAFSASFDELLEALEAKAARLR